MYFNGILAHEVSSNRFHIDSLERLLVLLRIDFEANDWVMVRQHLVDDACSRFRSALKAEPKVEPKTEPVDGGARAAAPAAAGPAGDGGRLFRRAIDPVWAAMLKKIEDLKKVVKKLLIRLRATRSVSRRFKKKWGGVKTEHRRAKKKDPADAYHVGPGKKRAHISQFGGVTLALMRAVMATAAIKMGTSSHTDVSHQSVLRWERKVGACLIVSCREWYQEMECLLRDPPNLRLASLPTNWGIHSPRMDGTNRKLVHKEQLQVLVVDSKYSVLDKSGVRITERQENYADVLPIDGHTAAHTHALTLKQLEGLGAPHWRDMVKLDHELANVAEDGSFVAWKGGTAPNFIEFFCCSTDNGSDEKKVRDIADFELAPVPFVFWFELACLLHQYHLLAKALLLGLDSFLEILEIPNLYSKSYFSNIATMSNTIREYSRDIKKSYLSLYPLTPVRIAGQIPPRCLVGRWGASQRFQKFLLARDFAELAAVCRAAFAKSESAKPRAPSASTPVDEEAADATEQFYARLGRWRKACLQSSESIGLRWVVACSQCVQDVLDHLNFMLMSTEYEHGTFLELLFRGNAEIRVDLNKLGLKEQWDDIFRWRPECCDHSKSIGLCLWHSAQAASDYQFRFADTLQSYPLRFFLITKEAADVSDCPVRKSICYEMRTLPDHMIGDTMVKVRNVFGAVLEHAETHGVIPAHVHQMFLEAGEMLRATTQDVEGTNNILLELCKRASHVLLQTVSDRMRIRRKVASLQSTRWSSVKGNIDRTRAACLSVLPRIDTVLEDDDRYTTPPPVAGRAKWAAKVPEREKLWRAPFNGNWMSRIKPDGFQSVLTFSGDSIETEAWLLTKTHSNIGFVVAAKVELFALAADGTGAARLRLEVPFRTAYSFKVLGTFFEDVQNNSKVVTAHQ